MVEQSPATSAERQTGQERSSETTSPPRRERQFTRGRRPGGRGGGRGRPRRPRQCAFCVSKVSDVDYKQVDLLRPYVTNRGKIRPRRQTGLCAKHQRRVARAIKRARHLALIPYTTGGHGRFPD